MQDLYEGDLTEKMLVKQLTSVETSLISNSVKEFHKPSLAEHHITLGGYSEKWYRQLHKATWIVCGMKLSTLDECISKISASTNKRSRDEYIDTVESYGEGNWTYEFMHKATELHNSVGALIEAGKKEEALKLMQEAGVAYSVASYPNLNGDKKALQAQVNNVKNYRDYLNLGNIGFKELEVPVDLKGIKHNIKAWLLHPKKDEPVPLIVFAGSLETLFSDYDKLYQFLVRKLGCAVVCMDNPRTGQNSSVPLDHDSSVLHRNVLDYLVANEPIIDKNRIGAVGLRFGGNIVTRLSFMRCNLLKFSVLIGAAVNKVFVDNNNLDLLSQMQRAIICNKIDKDAAEWNSCLPILSQFSLKKQGLLGTITKTPIKVLYSERDFFCDEEDAKLLVRSSAGGELVKLKPGNLTSMIDTIIKELQESVEKYFKVVNDP